MVQSTKVQYVVECTIFFQTESTVWANGLVVLSTTRLIVHIFASGIDSLISEDIVNKTNNDFYVLKQEELRLLRASLKPL